MKLCRKMVMGGAESVIITGVLSDTIRAKEYNRACKPTEDDGAERERSSARPRPYSTNLIKMRCLRKCEPRSLGDREIECVCPFVHPCRIKISAAAIISTIYQFVESPAA